MKQLTFIAAGMALAASLSAQNTKPVTAAFQYINVGPGSNATFVFDTSVGGPVTGKPFSATEERHSLQTLGDGTRLEKTETDKIYRDAQGRTRIERPDGTATIQDPAEGKVVELNTSDRRVLRRTSRVTYSFKSNYPDLRVLDQAKEELTRKKLEMEALVTASLTPSSGTQSNVVMRKHAGEPDSKPENASGENLGTQVVNGVNAEGRRTVIDIPAGQIGNDRPMKVISERWFSNELQMVIKTVNSDPRFGENTFQMSNIYQGAPDPSLFEVPAGYTEPPMPQTPPIDRRF